MWKVVIYPRMVFVFYPHLSAFKIYGEKVKQERPNVFNSDVACSVEGNLKSVSWLTLQKESCSPCKHCEFLQLVCLLPSPSCTAPKLFSQSGIMLRNIDRPCLWHAASLLNSFMIYRWWQKGKFHLSLHLLQIFSYHVKWAGYTDESNPSAVSETQLSFTKQ